MIKENIADSILARINKRVEAISGRLSTQYKGVKPFDSKKVNPEDQLYYYEHLSPMDMEYLMTKYGRDMMNEFVYNMESLKQRRIKNAV